MRVNRGDWWISDPRSNQIPIATAATVAAAATKGHQLRGLLAAEAGSAGIWPLDCVGLERERRPNARSRADWNRSAGFFSMQCATTCETPGGTVWGRSGGSSFRIAFMTSTAESAWN